MMQSCKLHLRRLGVTVGLIAAMSLAGCGGDDNSSSTSTVSGTAATGAPITGATVTFIGKNGKTASATTGATDGKFSADVKELTFPAIIKVDGGTAGTLYSVAEASNTTVNITPLTTIALVLLPGLSDDLGANYADWANQASNVTNADLTEAIKKVNANLLTLDTSNSGIDWTTYNFLTTAFNANSLGADKTLDLFKWAFNFAAEVFSQIVSIQNPAGTTNFVFNDAISTAGINLGGGTTPPPGGANNGSLVCNPGQIPGARLPTVTELTNLSGTYVADEGTTGATPNDPPFTKTGTATVILSSAGAVTYNTALQTVSNMCFIPGDNMILAEFANGGHIDFFAAGTMAGAPVITPTLLIFNNGVKQTAGGGNPATGLGAYAGTYNMVCASSGLGACTDGQTYVLTVTAGGQASINGHSGSGTPATVSGIPGSETFIFGAAPPMFSVGFINNVPVNVTNTALNGFTPQLSVYTSPSN